MNIRLSLPSLFAMNFFQEIDRSAHELSIFSSTAFERSLSEKAARQVSVTMLAENMVAEKQKDLIIILRSLEWDSTTRKVFRKLGLVRTQKSLSALSPLELSLWILRNIFVSTSKKERLVRINFRTVDTLNFRV